VFDIFRPTYLTLCTGPKAGRRKQDNSSAIAGSQYDRSELQQEKKKKA
jgi:hypothetical protein